MNVKIVRAERNDLEEILNLQYLAYQSEAALFKSKDIPPLKQTLDDLTEEYGRRLLNEMEKCYPGKRYELFTSTRSEANIRLYQRAGYTVFDQKPINEDLIFVFLEKVDELTKQLRSDGFEVVSGPRTTGDGYYESCIVVIEENQIEITV